jgi:hypothetical protein
MELTSGPLDQLADLVLAQVSCTSRGRFRGLLQPGAEQFLLGLDQALVPTVLYDGHTGCSVSFHDDSIFQQGSFHSLAEASLYIT